MTKTEIVCSNCGVCTLWSTIAGTDPRAFAATVRCPDCFEPYVARSHGRCDKPDKRKQSLYFPEWMLDEMRAEAVRLDRSFSWVVQRAFRVAKPALRKLPSASLRAAAEMRAEASP